MLRLIFHTGLLPAKAARYLSVTLSRPLWHRGALPRLGVLDDVITGHFV